MKNSLYKIIKERTYTFLIENIVTGEQIEIWKSGIIA